MNKQERNYPTRMHEVLGVDENEEFELIDYPGTTFFVNENGWIYVKWSSGRHQIAGQDYWASAINHGIIRKPRRREQEKREMTPEERLLRAMLTKSEQDEMPDNYPATHLDKADYAQFCLHKSLASISPALGRISRLCGLLRVSEKDGKNTLPDIIAYNESRMALKRLASVKRDVDDAYQEILSIFENTKEPKEPGTVSKTESVGLTPDKDVPPPTEGAADDF